jgi:hypothetical protein
MRLAGAAEALNDATGRVMPASWQPIYEAQIGAARARMVDPQTAFSEGKRLSEAAAMEYALASAHS